MSITQVTVSQVKRNSIMAMMITTAPAPTTSSLKAFVTRHQLVTYFTLAFAFSWLPVLPLTLSRNAGIGVLPYELPDIVMTIMLVLTIFMGPTLAALIVTGMTEGRTGVKRFLKRFVQWRVGWPWYLVALFTCLGIWLLAYAAVVGLPLLVGA